MAAIVAAVLPLLVGHLSAQTLPVVEKVEYQPLVSSVQRLVRALEFIGAPMSAVDRAALKKAIGNRDHGKAVLMIQEVLDRQCLLAVHISPESRVKVVEGPAKKELMEQGWRAFVFKVINEAEIQAPLMVESPNLAPVFVPYGDRKAPAVKREDIPHRFLDVGTWERPPLKKNLSGLRLEYRLIQLYSRARGKREAVLSFNVGQGTQDLGFRGELPILFACRPAVPVTLDVIDHDGKPVTASFIVRDERGRIYPHPGRRLAPDMFFVPQVYRRHGETLLLPPGKYKVHFGRGPEYVVQERAIVVPKGKRHRETFKLKRWIHAAGEGWYSGDHHIHAAGCAHYRSPTEGVSPADIIRQVAGEDLSVGCVLSWGPGWYFQKRFFQGKVDEHSTDSTIIRYDVEVSGFPSSPCGHQILLGLKEDDYPGTTRHDQWPRWNLPILQWAKGQGAVTGYAHSGFGLNVKSSELPNYEIPLFFGIGAIEYIMDVTHGAIDFLSTVNTPSVWELNIWYHTLNCGFRTRISGETDFPCIHGERVGLGRVYVKIPKGQFNYDNWLTGLRDGRSYTSTGTSHLMDFAVDGVNVGEKGNTGKISQLDLKKSKRVTVTARVAAMLPETADRHIKKLPLDKKPYWHIERARVGAGRKVAVELVVNGVPKMRQEIVADGSIVPVTFKMKIEKSSWLALRIFPASHTNPVFVIVDDKPVRASRKSAEWCLKALRASRKLATNARGDERKAANKAYDHAEAVYVKILEESTAD